jgi:hypothetical protein
VHYAYRRFDYGHRLYGVQLEFIEWNAPFSRTFAPIDTCFLGVFFQNSAFLAAYRLTGESIGKRQSRDCVSTNSP